MKTLAFLISTLLLLLFWNCSNPQKKEITTTLNTFFKSKNDFRTIDKALMTKDLASLIQKALEREALEVEKIKNSKFPTDKPLCIEGDVFSSLYEGQDSLKILEIKINGTKATALLEFTNTQYKETWKDEVILLNENGWKIDNVFFKGNEPTSNSTKELLLNLINFK